MQTKTLLIDGDILIYKIATSNEVDTHWGDGLWTLHCDENACKAEVDAQIEDLGSQLAADNYVVALTDKHNFRKDVLPTYKSNRAGKRKPMVLNSLRKYIMEKHNGVIWKNLEADDVLGIMATEPSDDQRIIVSIDKDLKQIPAFISVDGHVVEETPKRLADYWFMLQTLTGDAVDGYAGLPTVGIKTAEKLINKYTNVPILDLWKVVVELYKSKGFLRHGEYNKDTGAVKLWMQ